MEDSNQNPQRTPPPPLNEPQPIFPSVQTTQSNFQQSVQLPSSLEEKPKSRRKMFFILFGIFVAVGIILITAIVISKPTRTNINSDRNDDTPTSTKSIENERNLKVDIGEILVVMHPGITNIHLPSGASITFGHAGSSVSVPDFIFGDKYLLNDIHNINYLPIRKSIIAFHNGYKYEVTNLGCNTQRRFDIDITITEVTDCTIKIVTTKELPPSMNFESSNNKYSVVEHGPPVNSYINNQSTSLLYLSAGSIRVQSNSKGEKYVEPGTYWDVYIITRFGVDTIRYDANELWNKESKTVIIGPQEITIKIDNLSCNNIVRENKCPYFTTIDFTAESTLVQNSNIPIKVLNYQ